MQQNQIENFLFRENLTMPENVYIAVQPLTNTILKTTFLNRCQK